MDDEKYGDSKRANTSPSCHITRDYGRLRNTGPQMRGTERPGGRRTWFFSVQLAHSENAAQRGISDPAVLGQGNVTFDLIIHLCSGPAEIATM